MINTAGEGCQEIRPPHFHTGKPKKTPTDPLLALHQALSHLILQHPPPQKKKKRNFFRPAETWSKQSPGRRGVADVGALPRLLPGSSSGFGGLGFVHSSRVLQFWGLFLRSCPSCVQEAWLSCFTDLSLSVSELRWPFRQAWVRGSLSVLGVGLRRAFCRS